MVTVVVLDVVLIFVVHFGDFSFFVVLVLGVGLLLGFTVAFLDTVPVFAVDFLSVPIFTSVAPPFVTPFSFVAPFDFGAPPSLPASAKERRNPTAQTSSSSLSIAHKTPCVSYTCRPAVSISI